MQIGKTIRKTTTKMQTLTPRWKETFYFDVPNQTDTITIQAFDYDMIGDNELIGEIQIPLIVAATSHGRPRVYELHHPDPAVEDKRKSVGKIVLGLMWVDEEAEHGMQVIGETDAIMTHLDTLGNARRSFSQMLSARPSFDGLRASFSRSSRASKIGPGGSSDGMDPDEEGKDPKQGKHALQELLGVKKLSTKRPSGDGMPSNRSMRKKSATATSMPTDIRGLTADAAAAATAEAEAEAAAEGPRGRATPSSDKLLALADKIAAERVAEAKAKRAAREAAKRDPTEDPKYMDPRARREFEKRQAEGQEALAAMQAKDAAKEGAKEPKDPLATPAGSGVAGDAAGVAAAVAAGATAAATANGGGGGGGEGGKGWQAARASLGRRQSWADLAATMEDDNWKSADDMAKEAEAKMKAEAEAAAAAAKLRPSFERRPSIADIADGAAKFRRLSSGMVTAGAAEIAKDGGTTSLKSAAHMVKRMSRASLSFTADAAAKLTEELASTAAKVSEEMWRSDGEMLGNK